MNYKDIIFGSLKSSLTLLWKNKLWFMLLFILEILFFAILSVLSYNYQTKIVEHSNAIFEYLSKLNLDEATVADNIIKQKNLLGDDPLLISREFNEVLKNFRLLLLSIFFSLIIFLSFAWAITSKVIYKFNYKKLVILFSKIFAVLLFYLGLIFSFFYYLLNLSLSQIVLQTSMLLTKYILFVVISLALLYFMFISLSIAHKTELKNIAQKTLVAGIRKVHYVLSVYTINLFLLALSIIIFFMFFERSILVLFISTIMIIFNIVFGRFLLIKTLDKMD